jgi:hypothetical protein
VPLKTLIVRPLSKANDDARGAPFGTPNVNPILWESCVVAAFRVSMVVVLVMVAACILVDKHGGPHIHDVKR